MQLEQQVVSLELAKRLKELGVKQESHFHWIENRDGNFYIKDEAHPVTWNGVVDHAVASAFSIAELGEMLPGNFNGHYCRFQKGLMGHVWFGGLFDLQTSKELFQLEDKIEANARAKMMVYLLENKLLTL